MGSPTSLSIIEMLGVLRQDLIRIRCYSSERYWMLMPSLRGLNPRTGSDVSRSSTFFEVSHLSAHARPPPGLTSYYGGPRLWSGCPRRKSSKMHRWCTRGSSSTTSHSSEMRILKCRRSGNQIVLISSGWSRRGRRLGSA